MIATVALAVYLLAEADFSRSGRRKIVGGVLDDRSACSARDECRVFHNSSFGRNFINLARPFTACISSALPSTGLLAVSPKRRKRSMQCNFTDLFILAKISKILKERYADFLLAAR